MRGLILLLVHPRATAPVRASPPSKRSPRDPQRRGDMWAPLVVGTLRVDGTSPRSRRWASCASSAPQSKPRRFERARSRASAARPLFAHSCSAAAAVFDDDWTLKSAAVPLRLALALHM